MKTKIFLLLCLFLGIGLMDASAQNGTTYHSYPTKMNNAGGFFWVTCDGVNVDYLEYQWNGMDIVHARPGETWWLKDIAHWTFVSNTGEKFHAAELDKSDISVDSEGNWINGEGIWRAILIGDKGTRYKMTLSLQWIAPSTIYFEFLDFKCF